MYRNNAGVSYPYNIANLISIKQSNANTPLNFYYFFYDWEIETPSCSSARKPVTISMAQPPTSSSNISSCTPNTFNLFANGSGNGTLNWYDSSTGGNYLSSGNNFTTPLLSSTQTFYVEDSIPAPSVYGAPSDNTIGAGANYNGNQHLIFDCLSASVLKSVKVYASTAGNRTVELRDDNGTVLDSRVVYVPIGESRIDLDFSIAVGTDYQLGTTNGVNQDLFRNSAGANYPYNINGLLEITTSSAGLLGYPDYYYFFYDWEVSGPPCITPRTPVQVVIDPNGAVSIQTVGTVCSNNNAFNLAASSPGGVWSGSGIIDSSLGTFDPAVAGIGTHQIIYSISGSTCNGADTIDIVVSAVSLPTITPVSSVCSSAASFSLNVSSAGGVWSGPGITDTINGVFDPSIAGAGNHTILYTVAGTCGGVDQITIVVNNTQDPTISPLNSNNVCLTASPFSLTSVTQGGVWSGNGISNASTGVFDPQLAGVGTHLITYSFSGICASSDTITLIVDSVSNATINPVSPLCNDAQSFNLSAATSGGSWSGPGISDPAQGTFVPSNLNPGVYTVYYSINSGCGANDQVDITILAQPNINAGIDQNLCEGDSAVLSATGGISYQWDNGVVDGQSFVPNGSTTYTVIGTDSNGCSNTDDVVVSVNSHTTSVLTLTALDSLELNGQVYNQSGTYVQVIPNSNGCDSTITINLNLNFTGIDELGSYGLSAYPNPTMDIVNIIGIENLTDVSIINVLDSKGALVKQIQKVTKSISLEDFETGIYYIEIHHLNGRAMIKIVKE